MIGMGDLDLQYPAISDLRERARRKIPKFIFEYLDSATGRELGLKINRDALDSISFMQRILCGEQSFNLSKKFLGHTYDLPIGAAPVGMSGLIWGGAERSIAAVAKERNIPNCLSSVAVAAPEELDGLIGENSWFQHYPVNSFELMRAMLSRVESVGYRTLVVTVDVPLESRRERQRKANLTVPPKIDLETIYQVLAHPHWAYHQLRQLRIPRMRFFDDYIPQRGRESFTHAGALIRGIPDWEYIARVRDTWSGNLIVKGVLRPEDAIRLMQMGVDSVWVSNHSGRQFEAGPAVIDQLPKIREAVGVGFPLIYDSGVAGGLDVMRGLAKGADLVMVGRAFHYAVAAFQKRGVEHLIDIFKADLTANLSQIGCDNIANLEEHLLTR